MSKPVKNLAHVKHHVPETCTPCGEKVSETITIRSKEGVAVRICASCAQLAIDLLQGRKP